MSDLDNPTYNGRQLRVTLIWPLPAELEDTITVLSHYIKEQDRSHP